MILDDWMGSIYPEWYKQPARARRRMDNPEQNDDSLTAITLQECYRLQDAMTRIDKLSDMGIYPISRWSLKAWCYLHGWQACDVETTELAPTQRRIECWSCGRALHVTARVRED